ncbi:hypothetical protein PF011_g32126 [Phytophthora fragariae]|uniref:Uncharacterized protein n=1 Tax=Phytophthora fragariae TaxID=53985 RepID=A0A6A3GBW4_9STRA|nr:hypothetical protein PF011_g32126 [Phytophthora fragariae]
MHSSPRANGATGFIGSGAGDPAERRGEAGAPPEGTESEQIGELSPHQSLSHPIHQVARQIQPLWGHDEEKPVDADVQPSEIG